MMKQTKIYGHRGSMGTTPENTLLGIRHALDLGVDGIELDVQLTKDGEVVVIHDEKIDRTTDGSGYVKNYHLHELKQYSAGIKFSHFESFDQEVWGKEQIPTLEEVLELMVPYGVELNIELKTDIFPYDGMEEKVISLVNQFNYADKVIYSSFHLPSILKLKKMEPSAKIAWLLGTETRVSRPYDYAQSLELEAFHLHKDFILRSENVEQGSDECKIRVWTVNDEKEIEQLLTMNHIEAIITDFPEEAICLKRLFL